MWRTFGRDAAALLCCALAPPAGAADAPSWPSTLPRYDHIVIVVEENKDYDQIVGSPAAPYLNKLASEGASLVRMFAEEHPSQGNYFWLFSGGNQSVGFFDQVPRAKLTASSLGEQLIKKGLSFADDRFPRSTSLHRAAATPAFMAASGFQGSALPMFRAGEYSGSAFWSGGAQRCVAEKLM
jgi:hypothetical protein